MIERPDLTRHFPRREALTYIAAQLLGAIAAAALLLAVWPRGPAALGATLPTVGAGSALIYEAVMSAFLMFVIMAVTTDTRAVGTAPRSRSAALSASTPSSAVRSPAPR